MYRALMLLVFAAALHGQRLELTASRCVAGDVCYLRYVLTNTGSTEIALEDREPLLLLRTVDGERALSRPPEQRTHALVLAPGGRFEEALRLDERFDAKPGSYQILGVFREAGIESKPVPLEIKAVEALALGVPVVLNLPEADRVALSWIAAGPGGGRVFMEQVLVHDADTDRFSREQMNSRTPLPDGARELTSARAGASKEKPLRWIFWRVGDTVYGKGPPAMSPERVALPAGAGLLVDTPVMGASGRADLFYLTGAGRQRQLVAARFCDRSRTPNETSKMIATVPLPMGVESVAVAIDGGDRRHIVMAGRTSGVVVLYRGTLDATGKMSAVQKFAEVADRAFQPFAGGASVAFGEGGVMLVAVAGVSDGKPALLTMRGEGPPTIRLAGSALRVSGGRAAAGSPPAAAWWLADGRVVLQTGKELPAGGGDYVKAVLPIRGRPYVLQFGPSGLRMIPIAQ